MVFFVNKLCVPTWLLLSSLVFLVSLLGTVTCARNMDQPPFGSFKPVRKGVQSFTAFFFGCAGLNPTSANITCTNKIEKLTKGVNCSAKVPLGTRATFTCLDDTVLKESYAMTVCKFPGTWKPAPPTCAPKPQEVTTISVTPEAGPLPGISTVSAAITAAAATTASAANTAGAATTAHSIDTASVATTVKAITMKRPLLLPIGTKSYQGIGNLSIFETNYNITTALDACADRTETLFTINSNATKDATLDLMNTFGVTPSFMYMNVEIDLTTHALTTYAGAPVTVNNFCPTHPLYDFQCTQFRFRDECFVGKICAGSSANFVCQG